MSPKSARRTAASKTCLNLSVIRERAGLSIAQIAESTKISSRFLRAVEAEAFTELPGGIFATSYIRQYADAIGMDSAEILKVYYESTPGAAPVQTAPAAPAGGNSARDANRLGWLRWIGVTTAGSRS